MKTSLDFIDFCTNLSEYDLGHNINQELLSFYIECVWIFSLAVIVKYTTMRLKCLFLSNLKLDLAGYVSGFKLGVPITFHV